MNVYLFDGDIEYYIELDNQLYATRQIMVDNNLTMFNKKVQVSCRDFCLAEGIVDINDYTNTGLQAIEISNSEFQYLWDKHTQTIKEKFLIEKSRYPIGAEVFGIVKYFYPQGVIFKVGNIQGCADYQTCRNNSNPKDMYPNHKIYGKVIGYDFNNYWILLGNCKVI